MHQRKYCTLQHIIEVNMDWCTLCILNRTAKNTQVAMSSGVLLQLVTKSGYLDLFAQLVDKFVASSQYLLQVVSNVYEISTETSLGFHLLTPYSVFLFFKQTLMNRLFESPHDCYMKLLPTYWPPYIQLLLRSNIIQRHPDNCELIKLVAFHN